MPLLKKIFEGQGLHAIDLAVLLILAALVSQQEESHAGQFAGVDSLIWYWVAIGIAVIHQSYVWFCWRIQLYTSGLTRCFGNSAFVLYAIGFSIFGISRVGLVFIVAIANQGIIQEWPILLKGFALLLLIPVCYLFYSVKRYFSFRRAFGWDHFDESCRHLPWVRQGIFKYTRNGMYTYGFLLFWVPGLWFGSPLALALALFNHLYIWIHFYATECPDLQKLYPPNSPEKRS